jgi:hypothetical protein
MQGAATVLTVSLLPTCWLFISLHAIGAIAFARLLESALGVMLGFALPLSLAISTHKLSNEL